jgi:RNA polymerase sigma-70 factor (ECF subfamily)
MATPIEMTTFLAEVERRAFKQAMHATHDEAGRPLSPCPWR